MKIPGTSNQKIPCSVAEMEVPSRCRKSVTTETPQLQSSPIPPTPPRMQVCIPRHFARGVGGGDCSPPALPPYQRRAAETLHRQASTVLEACLCKTQSSALHRLFARRLIELRNPASFGRSFSNGAMRGLRESSTHERSETPQPCRRRCFPARGMGVGGRLLPIFR